MEDSAALTKGAVGKSTGRVAALDGVRALGIFMVVAGHFHAFGYAEGQEIWGNYIFFILSGFVSVEPWSADIEEKFLSFSYITQFYVKRFMRIMPVLFCATILQALIEPGTVLHWNLLLTNPYYISWFIKNIVIYYLFFPLIMVFFYGIKRVILQGQGSNLWIALGLLAIAFADYQFRVFRLPIIISSTVGPFQIKYILVGCAAGYLCKSERVQRWMRKSSVQHISGIFCGVCILLILFCKPFLYGLAVANYVKSVMALEWLIIVIVLALIVGTYFSHAGSIYNRVMAWKPIAYIGNRSLAIMLVHVPLLHLALFSGGKQLVFAAVTSMLVAILLNLLVEEPLTRFTKAACKKIDAQKTIRISAFAAVMLYVLVAFLVAHSRAYTFGSDAGLAAENAMGLRYTTGLSSAEIGGTWVKKDAVTFRFRLAAVPAEDFLFTLSVEEITGTSQEMTVQVQGTEIETVELTGKTAVFVQIPANTVQERNLEIICSFSEGATLPARLSAVKLSELAKDVLGTELSFTREKQTANSYFTYGLREAEQAATWAKGTARLDIPIGKLRMKALDLKLNWAAVDSTAQRMIVTCGEMLLLDHTFLYETGTTIHIPKECVASEILTLTFEFPNACPSSFAFTTMALSERSAYQMGTELNFTTAAPEANLYFVYGLGPAEEKATWAKDTAQLSLPFSEAPQKDVTVDLTWLAVDTHAQRMIVSCRGEELWNQEYPSEEAVALVVPQRCIADGVLTLDFSFPDACPSSFAFSSMCVTEA